MGTTIGIITAPETTEERMHQAVTLAMGIFEREEQRFSRFRPDSELCQVNAAAAVGADSTVSEPFAAVTAMALLGAAETQGLFDPTMLHGLEAAGYDRDFPLVQARDSQRRRSSSMRLHPSTFRPQWTEVHLHGNHLSMPPTVALDLGGIAKGWTADRVAEAAIEILDWVLIDAGGDIRIEGNAPVLPIAIEDPFDGSEGLRINLQRGAIATSSTMRRRWANGQHHLIDPRTGEPSRTGIVQATVWAATCADAEIRAKRAMLAGSAALAGEPVALVFEDGTMVTSFDQAMQGATW